MPTGRANHQEGGDTAPRDPLSGKHTLFSHTKKLLRSGQCPEGSKSDEGMEVEDMLTVASPLF